MAEIGFQVAYADACDYHAWGFPWFALFLRGTLRVSSRREEGKGGEIPMDAMGKTMVRTTGELAEVKSHKSRSPLPPAQPNRVPAPPLNFQHVTTSHLASAPPAADPNPSQGYVTRLGSASSGPQWYRSDCDPRPAHSTQHPIFNSDPPYHHPFRMSLLDKFRAGAQKAGIQATAFLKDGSNKLANESRDFVQGFSLPGEAEKAAKILESFLGAQNPPLKHQRPRTHCMSAS